MCRCEMLKSLRSAHWWGGRNARRHRPLGNRTIEAAESRILLALRVWTGGAITNDRWSDKDNWQGDVVPVAGDDLEFPAGIISTDRGVVNDLGSVASKLRNITFRAGDYKVTGNPITLSGNLTVLGSSTEKVVIENDITFTAANHRITHQTPLELNGRLKSLTGTGEIRKSGTGKLTIGGEFANTWKLPFFVEDGTVQLFKKNAVAALGGPITIGTGVGTSAELIVSSANAIANSPPVTIATSLGGRSGTLNIGVKNVRVGTLRMIGGIVVGTIGQLQLNGDLIAEGLPGLETGNKIDSRVVLGTSQRKINVIGEQTSLTIEGSIRDSGAIEGILKQGTGVLEFRTSTEANIYRGRTTVSEGILRLLPATSVLNQIPAELLINNTGKVENQAVNVIADTVNIRLIGQGVYHQQTGAESVGSVFGIENSQLLVSAAGVFNVLNGSTLARLDLIDTARVTLTGDTRVLGGIVTTQESSQLTLAGNLILRGGRVDGQGSNPILFQRNITAEASPLPAVLAGKIAFAAAPFQAVSHRLDVFDGPNATDLLIEGTIEPGSSNLKLFKAATGTMVIQGNVNAANTIELAAGNMFVNSTLAQANVVVSQGVLGGIGQFRNVTLNGGTLSPGLSPGLMNAENFIFGPAARYRVELNGVTPVTQHDQISAGGVILGDFINGFPTLEVLVNFNTSLGQEFEIANVNNDTGATGRFKDLNGVTLEEGSEFLAGGKNFRISYVGGDGNDVTIRRVSGSPAFENRALTPVVDEGGFVTLSGLITEPDEEDTFFLDVDWGDGTVETFTFLPGTPRQIAVAHQYLVSQDAPIPVHVAWRDDHGGGNSAVLSTQVRNVAPVIIGPEFDAPPAPGESSTLRFRIYDPSPFDAFRVEIRWGDRSPVEVVELPAGTTQVELAHQFRRRPSRVRISVTEVSAPST